MARVKLSLGWSQYSVWLSVRPPCPRNVRGCHDRDTWGHKRLWTPAWNEYSGWDEILGREVG